VATNEEARTKLLGLLGQNDSATATEPTSA
jgi:hypothetical protein